jgi:hypothetical protein
MVYISSNNVRHPVAKTVGARDFVFSKSLEFLWGPPNLLRGCRIYFTEAKRLGFEVNHSSRSSAEVKKQWSYTCMPPIYLRKGIYRQGGTDATEQAASAIAMQ